jgi:hypothetical protein
VSGSERKPTKLAAAEGAPTMMSVMRVCELWS